MCRWCQKHGRNRSLDEWEPENGHFDGSGSNQLPNINNCDMCNMSMPFASWMAYLDPIIDRRNQQFQQVVTGKFDRQFDAETESIYVCIFCKGDLDGVSYIKEKRDQRTGEPLGKYIPSSDWYKLMQAS